MLKLDNVTLLTIDGINSEICAKVLNYNAQLITFRSVKLLSFKEPAARMKNVEFIKIDPMDLTGYSNFVIKHLHEYVDTEFCLIVQPDGFVINPALWSENFLHYDFIGAPLSDFPEWLAMQPDEFRLFFLEAQFSASSWPMNGGFSLRSKRALELSAKCPYPVDAIPEDVYITVYHRNWFVEQGIKFAPRNLAYNFSKESPLTEGEYDFTKCFGFHGKTSPRHLRMMRLPFNKKSRIPALKKFFRIHPDISFKRFLQLKTKNIGLYSNADFLDYYNEYSQKKENEIPNYSLEIDLVIFAKKNDLAVLPFTLKYAKKHILHSIKHIYIIALNDGVFHDFCRQHNCQLIELNDAAILGNELSAVKDKIINDHLTRQLLTLYADLFCISENICVLDAQHVLIRDALFMKRNKALLGFSGSFHADLPRFFECLTGIRHKFPASFETGNVFLEKKKLEALRNQILKSNNYDLAGSVIKCAANLDEAAVSSEEIYANFVLNAFPAGYRLEYRTSVSQHIGLIGSSDYFAAFYKPSDIWSLYFNELD
jgi:hypothetical protein